jgi:hypothetical protein
MNKAQKIWKHEVCQAGKIARRLMDTDRLRPGWRIFVLPSALLDFLRMRRQLRLTRKNLLFTRSLALEAAEDISRGKDPHLALGGIEIRTKAILDREKKGLYTEKVRRKQLKEIQSLLDHYLALLKAEGDTYEALFRTVYPDREACRKFFDRLGETEKAVIQASISSIRKESKKGRGEWFAKVTCATDTVREEEMKGLYEDV